ncbi:MAG: cation diffusion facilitator family transporter [Candidatus Omnitrophica bacterium]|nr:cation diffusion facilitator family transporter [Candidatus Omnitrophota bacterium]MDD5236565.1 cation diffusion facilitator family transporter [Candidatus Omnitrophota bacterium]MDD5610208.1 cation diffusion facilitator family transporter [Candidatus Omnitrophota bacterium]
MTIEHPHHHNPLDKLSRLKFVLIITGIGMVIEFVGGFLSHSLALTSDAWHMLTHLFATGMSYFAVLLSLRPATKKRTYGFYRAEVLVAFINGFFLIFISAYIVYDAVLRFISPRQVNAWQMLLVTVIGLLINGTSTFLLLKVSRHDLNIRSAFLHEIGDMVSSIAVLAAGIIILYTKNYIADPILAFFISILIVIWSVKLIIESSNILLESTPKHLDIDDLVNTLKTTIPVVHDVHHVHAWTIASGLYSMTAHVVIDDCSISKSNEVLHKINELLLAKFHIAHTNIQFECAIRK